MRRSRPYAGEGGVRHIVRECRLHADRNEAGHALHARLPRQLSGREHRPVHPVDCRQGYPVASIRRIRTQLPLANRRS